ncbi:MAG: leucine-rich repeat domain-containing protein [Promethearchaeota archaeon]
MNLQPSLIYSDYRGQNIGKSKAVDLLIVIIENIENDDIRKECIDILNKIDIKQNRVFKILENILISDSNENLRYAATKVIKNKFREKALKPFLWALQHESCYNCLLTILKSLEEFSDKKVNNMLINEINKIENEKFIASLSSLFVINRIENYSTQDLAKILINHSTIFSLSKKFKKLKYNLENSLVSELDLSNVDDPVIDWRHRELLQDVTDIIGIQNLLNLKRIEFFPLNWALNNDLTFNCAMALIEALEGLNNYVAKNTLISQIEKIKDKEFANSIKDLLETNISFDNFSISNLSDILRNFITISYLKKRNSQLKYEIEKGVVIKLHIEGKPIVNLSILIKYLSSLRQLVLKKCNIYKFPESINTFKNLELLDLEGNNIEHLSFHNGIPNSLKVLNLNDNQLKNLPFSFGELYRLESLNLSNNQLTEIPDSLGHLSSLKNLNLGNNKLEKIPDSIGDLKSLKYLNLNSNKLTVLPESIGLLRSLELLNIAKNLLIKLPITLNLFSSLKSLNLEENKLTYLPESISNLRSLETLRLGWNKIISLPISIGSLRSLKSIYLIHNDLKKISDSISFLSSLETIDLTWNYLTSIPESIGNLTCLKNLKLGGNLLKELPESIGSLISLEVLNLDENKLNKLPDSICFLKSLQELWLNSNQLTYLPKSIGNISSLKKLLLNNNKLNSIPNSIEKISSLEVLSLEWNEIKNPNDVIKLRVVK